MGLHETLQDDWKRRVKQEYWELEVAVRVYLRAAEDHGRRDIG